MSFAVALDLELRPHSTKIQEKNVLFDSIVCWMSASFSAVWCMPKSLANSNAVLISVLLLLLYHLHLWSFWIGGCPLDQPSYTCCLDYERDHYDSLRITARILLIISLLVSSLICPLYLFFISWRQVEAGLSRYSESCLDKLACTYDVWYVDAAFSAIDSLSEVRTTLLLLCRESKTVKIELKYKTFLTCFEC